MKSKNLVTITVLAAALAVLAGAVLQSRQYRREIARLQERLAQTQAPAADLPAPPPAPAPAALPPPAHVAAAPAPAAAEPAPAASEPAVAPPAPPPEEEPWLASFDRAMDREFSRIEEREKSCQDPAELAGLAALKAALTDLDRTWTDMDAGEKSAAERDALANQARNQMVAVMRLAAADRNLRLARVARALGAEDPAQIDRFITDIDEVYRDTDLDWATLFSRGF